MLQAPRGGPLHLPAAAPEAAPESVRLRLEAGDPIDRFLPGQVFRPQIVTSATYLL